MNPTPDHWIAECARLASLLEQSELERHRLEVEMLGMVGQLDEAHNRIRDLTDRVDDLEQELINLQES